MKHGRYGYTKGCRCAECVEAERTYKREWGYRTGYHIPGRRGIKYSKCGVRVETVLPELEMLLKIHGTQRRVAELIGTTESSVYRMLARKRQPHMKSRFVKRIHLGQAQRITEALLGSRGMAEDHYQAERKRAYNARHAEQKRKRREKARAA